MESEIAFLQAMQRLIQTRLAELWAAQDALPGTGCTSLPTFPNMVAAQVHAAERTTETGLAHEPCVVGKRWGVRVINGVQVGEQS